MHAGLDGDLDVEGYAKGLLQEGDHTSDGWETVELFVNPDNPEHLPSLPENWVESLKTATAVANNGMIVVLDALHIQQWPTVEHKPKLMTELAAAVHEWSVGFLSLALWQLGCPLLSGTGC